MNLFFDEDSQKIILDAKEEMYVSTEGKNLEAGFNPKYFLDAFRAIDDEFINIGFNSPSNPCIVTPIEEKAREGFLFLVLPVRMM